MELRSCLNIQNIKSNWEFTGAANTNHVIVTKYEVIKKFDARDVSCIAWSSVCALVADMYFKRRILHGTHLYMISIPFALVKWCSGIYIIGVIV